MHNTGNSPASIRSSSRSVDSSGAARILETAQKLFGERGIDAVSLRQICRAAGSGNHFSVQYHFGSVSGLIQAILDKGMYEVERGRSHLLAQAAEQDLLQDPCTLMRVLVRPVADYLDPNGERLYARFLLALYNSPRGPEYTVPLLHQMPIARQILGQLRDTVPHVPTSLFTERIRLASILFLTSLFNRRLPFTQPEFDEALIQNGIDMATATLTAPVTASLPSTVSTSEAEQHEVGAVNQAEG